MNKEYKGDPYYPPLRDEELGTTVDPKSGYYDAGGIEVLDIIRAKLTKLQYIGFLLGNIIKYATRLLHKGQPERDAEKILNYAQLLKDAICETKSNR